MRQVVFDEWRERERERERERPKTISIYQRGVNVSWIRIG
jgi:hypothetical protein